VIESLCTSIPRSMIGRAVADCDDMGWSPRVRQIGSSQVALATLVRTEELIHVRTGGQPSNF